MNILLMILYDLKLITERSIFDLFLFYYIYLHDLFFNRFIVSKT